MKKKLAYIIGGEPRLIQHSFDESTVYKDLCKEYNVDVYIHCWTQEFKWTAYNNHYRWRRNKGYFPPGETYVKVSNEDIIEQYKIYEPKECVIEDYDEKFTIGDFPFGQYISRAKAYKNAVEQDKYDFVWLTRSDAIGVGPLHRMLRNKIYCPEAIFEDSRQLFRAEDWYYAGSTNMFENLIPFANDPLTAITNLYENKWLKENMDKIRNTHIWQALLTGGDGANVFQGDDITWKLPHY